MNFVVNYNTWTLKFDNYPHFQNVMSNNHLFASIIMTLCLRRLVHDFLVTEAKFDESFLESLFLMDGFSKSYRLESNRNGVGIIIFIRHTLSIKILEKQIFPNDVERIFVEHDFKKCKWLLCEYTIHHIRAINIFQ